MSRFILNYHFSAPSGPSSDEITWYGTQDVSAAIMAIVQGTLSSLSEVLAEQLDSSTIPAGTRRTIIAIAATADNSLYKFRCRNFNGGDDDALMEALLLGTGATVDTFVIAPLSGPPQHPITHDPFTRIVDSQNVLKS